MVVTGSEHPNVIRNLYSELVHTVRLENDKSHACQLSVEDWKLSRTTTVCNSC